MHEFEVRVPDDGEIAGVGAEAEMTFGSLIGNVAEVEFPESRVAPVRGPLALRKRQKRPAIDSVSRFDIEAIAKRRKNIRSTGEQCTVSPCDAACGSRMISGI
jgi:hypothetical protein